MKKTKIIATLVVSLILLSSCQSTKNTSNAKKEIATDDYGTNVTAPAADDSDNASKTVLPDDKKNKKSKKIKQESSSELHNMLAPKQPEGFGKKFLYSFNTSKRHLQGDNFTAFVKTATGSIKQQDMLTYYHTKDDKVGFGSPYYAAYYMIFFDEKNYKLLENCYNQYLVDFENQNLKRKNNKAYKAYGTLDATLNWGTIKASVPNYGDGKVYVGYSLVNNKAFFTIQNKDAFFNKYSEISDSVSKESLSVCYLFTKSQMENMLKHTSREYMYDLLCKDIVISEVEDLDSY